MPNELDAKSLLDEAVKLEPQVHGLVDAVVEKLHKAAGTPGPDLQAQMDNAQYVGNHARRKALGQE